MHSALGDLDAAFRMLIAGSRVQASSNDAAAMEFLQPPHIELEALAQNKPKGSPEAAAQVTSNNVTPDWRMCYAARGVGGQRSGALGGLDACRWQHHCFM